jgi:predicted MFS family arabinose efflux permease
MSTAAVHAPIRPKHDRPTLVSFAALASWSWFVYGFGASLALLRDDQGTSAWIGGLHGTALAAGGIVGALVTPRLNHRFGRGPVARAAVIGTALCIVAYTRPGLTVGWTLAAIFVTCFFGNILVVGVNSFLASHHGPASPAAFTESTGLAALMGLLAPLGIGFAATTVLGWRTGLLVSVLAFAIIEVCRGRRLAVYGGPGEVLTRKEGGALPGLTWWALTAGMTYIGAEFCLSLWGADLLRERAGLSPAAAAAGLSTVLGGLFVGRLLGVRLAERMSTERLLRISLVSGLLAFGVVWIATVPAVILTFLFLTGVGLSLTWPLSMSRIIRAAAGNTDRASAMALAFTTTAIGVAPFLLGSLTRSVSVHAAFLIVPVLLVVTLVLVVLRPVAEDVIPASPAGGSAGK